MYFLFLDLKSAFTFGRLLVIKLVIVTKRSILKRLALHGILASSTGFKILQMALSSDKCQSVTL